MRTDPRDWGTRPEERAVPYPCDRLLDVPAEDWFRAISVRADRSTVFRWLCQLRVAPYSYDGLDNFGRRSPRKLTPGADELRRGQRVMTIFALTDFEPDRQLTLILDRRWARRAFGDFAISYTVHDGEPGTTRLVVKMRVAHRRGLIGRVHSRVMARGDLLMMRRQLRTLGGLAEAAG